MPYQHLFRDPVIAILILASILSWAIIIDCIVVLRRSAAADRRYLADKSSKDSSLFQIEAKIQHNIDAPIDLLFSVIDTEVAIQQQKLERWLPVLGAIGSTAPYMGLLGTVIGIIQAFQSIQAQNNMSPSIVAGGIATALFATAIGLAVAIPAVVAHHLISSSISQRISSWESAITGWLSDRGIR